MCSRKLLLSSGIASVLTVCLLSSAGSAVAEDEKVHIVGNSSEAEIIFTDTFDPFHREVSNYLNITIHLDYLPSLETPAVPTSLAVAGKSGENLSLVVPSNMYFRIEVRFYRDSLFSDEVSLYRLRNSTEDYDGGWWPTAPYKSLDRKVLVMNLAFEILCNRYVYYNLNLLRLAHKELIPVRRDMEVFGGVGYDIAPYESVYSRINTLLDGARKLHKERNYPAAVYTTFQAKALFEQLRGSILMLESLSVSSFVFSFFLIFVTSLVVGTFFKKGKKRHLSEYLLFVSVVCLFGFFHPDYQYTLQYAILPSIGARFPATITGWFLVCSLLATIVFAPARALMKKIATLFPITVHAVTSALRNLKRRRLRSSLLISTIFITVASLISITTVTAFYAPQPLVIGFVGHKVPAVIFDSAPPGPVENYPFVETISVITHYPPRPPPPPPVLVVVSPTGNHTIGEIYGITPSVADRLYDLADVADGWFSGDEAREILINPSTAEELGVSVGDEVCVYRSYRGVTYRVGNFTVCGLYDPRKASEVRGLDGSRLLDVHAPHVDIIATSRAAVSLGAETTRYTMVLKEGYDALEISSYFGLVYKFFGVTVKSGVVYGPSIPKANIAMAGVESYLVPLLLASLMIFSFAFGTVYERRGEIATLTSVGLNPSNIRNVILTEGFVAATIGGLSGSFVGIYLYPLAGFFFDLPGYVKSGPFYFLLTLGLIMFMALLGGYLPSRKAGMMTTPSIMRRWSLKKMGRKAGRAVQMKLPVTVLEEEYPRFEEYLQTHVQTEALEAGVRVKLDHVKKSDSANTYDFKVWSLSRTGLPAALCTLEATESDRKFSILLKVKARPYRREIVDAFRMVLLKYTEWGKKVRQPV